MAAPEEVAFPAVAAEAFPDLPPARLHRIETRSRVPAPARDLPLRRVPRFGLRLHRVPRFDHRLHRVPRFDHRHRRRVHRFRRPDHRPQRQDLRSRPHARRCRRLVLRFPRFDLLRRRGPRLGPGISPFPSRRIRSAVRVEIARRPFLLDREEMTDPVSGTVQEIVPRNFRVARIWEIGQESAIGPGLVTVLAQATVPGGITIVPIDRDEEISTSISTTTSARISIGRRIGITGVTTRGGIVRRTTPGMEDPGDADGFARPFTIRLVGPAITPDRVQAKLSSGVSSPGGWAT